MFFGGNFKGEINNNQISGSICGMEFAGKKAANNGRLGVTLRNNNIINVITGINMFHPCVKYLNLISNTISVVNSTCYAIQTNSYYRLNGRLILFNNNFTGLIDPNLFYII